MDFERAICPSTAQNELKKEIVMKANHLISVLAGLAVLPLQGEREQSLLVEYPFLCPSCDEEYRISVRYASGGASILEKHKAANVPLVHPSNDDSDYLPGNWVAGPMTDNRAGKIQRWEDEIGSNFIRVGVPALEEEVRYVGDGLTPAAEKPGQPSWSIRDFSVEIEEGGAKRRVLGRETTALTATASFTRVEYDAEGGETGQSEEKVVWRLWMTEDLPFSPLPFEVEPFKGIQVPPYRSGPVMDAVVDELTRKLRPYGGLAAAHVDGAEAKTSVEIVSVDEVPEFEMEKFAELPVLSNEQVDAFAGPLFIASLLRDGIVRDTADARLMLGDRELAGVSAWKTNEAGDFVLVVSAKEENTSLFLVRPLNGKPQPGSYGTSPRLSFGELRAMNETDFDRYTGDFQIFGVVTQDVPPTVITGFTEGTVKIQSAADGRLEGRVSGVVSALSTDKISSERAQPIEIRFRAEEGLENFRFRSNESRLRR